MYLAKVKSSDLVVVCRDERKLYLTVWGKPLDHIVLGSAY